MCIRDSCGIVVKWMNLLPGQPMPCEGNWVVSLRCWRDIDFSASCNSTIYIHIHIHVWALNNIIRESLLIINTTFICIICYNVRIIFTECLDLHLLRSQSPKYFSDPKLFGKSAMRNFSFLPIPQKSVWIRHCMITFKYKEPLNKARTACWIILSCTPDVTFFGFQSSPKSRFLWIRS